MLDATHVAFNYILDYMEPGGLIRESDAKFHLNYFQ